MDNLPSKYLQNAVDEFSKLPGIGKKTALRLVLHILRQNRNDIELFSHRISDLALHIKYCKVCHNISDTDVCEICSNAKRDPLTICVVENVKDVMAIENTQQFRGLYHVLGGIISPVDGIGPSDLEIISLIERVKNKNVKEVILALSTTMEGDTTNYYIHKKIYRPDLKVTTLARGVAFGDELEYTDEITLGRSILNRIDFNTN